MHPRPSSTAGSTRCSRSCSGRPTRSRSGCSARARTRRIARRRRAPGPAPTGRSCVTAGRLVPWVVRVSSNLAIDRWRRTRRARRHEAAFVSPGRSPSPSGSTCTARRAAASPARRRGAALPRRPVGSRRRRGHRLLARHREVERLSGARRVARRAHDRGGPAEAHRPRRLTPVEPDDDVLARADSQPLAAAPARVPTIASCCRVRACRACAIRSRNRESRP